MNSITIQEIKSKSNDINIQINGEFIHSKINPKREAIRIIDETLESYHTHILFGVGAGYIADELLDKANGENYENAKVIIIDPIANEIKPFVGNIFKYIFSFEQLSDFEKSLNGQLRSTNNRLKLICTPKYKELFKDEYMEILKIIKKQVKSVDVNIATIIETSKTWQENSIENIRYLIKDKNIFDLKLCTDIPVIVASGGPSLSKQLSVLKQIKDSVIIIASGSTINSLLANGIEPDYVVSVDGRSSHYKSHYENIIVSKTKLVYSMETNYKIRNKFTNPGYAFFSDKGQHLNNYLKKRLEIDSAGIYGGTSCANFAFAIAAFMSEGPVAFIGQDLAFTNKQSHASSNNDYHELSDENIEKNGYFYIEGYDGESVITSQLMYDMKMSFERQVLKVSNPERIFNCTEGGARIEQIKQVSFGDFVANYVEDTDADKKKKLNIDDIEYNDDDSFYKVLLREDIHKYEEIIEFSNFGVNIIDNALRQSVISEKKKKRLNKLEKKVTFIFEDLPAWRILETLNLQIKNNYLPNKEETKEDEFIRLMNQTKSKFENFIMIAKMLGEYSGKIIDRLELEENEQN